MRRLTCAGMLCLLLGFSSLAAAQEVPAPPEDAHLDAMVGHWQGTGTMMGMPMTEEMTSGWELNHQYLVTHGTASGTMQGGAPFTLESMMIHKPNGDGTYAGLYLDSMGNMGDFTAHIDESGAFVTEWEEPDAGSFRSVATMTEDGSMSYQMFMQAPDGTWTDSGTMTYTRME